MPDSRFFLTPAPLTLRSILKLTGAVVDEGVDTARTFVSVAPLQLASAENISFLDNTKYVSQLPETQAGACFVRTKYADKVPAGTLALITDDPYAAYALTAQEFYPTAQKDSYIHPTAVVDDTACIGKYCYIDAHAVIGPGVQVGDNVRIGANSTVTHAILGSNIIIHRGVHIGQDGFGFAPTKQGMVKVPQLGRVMVGDDVEIGSGTCIDRGAGPDTIIGRGTKIDNLVQIAHNVVIGTYCVIVAQVGIAGSAVIEDGVMIGGHSGIAGHITVGKNARLAAFSAAMKNIPPGETHGGAPAMPLKECFKQIAVLNKLAKKG